MDWLTWLLEWLAGVAQFVIGMLLGAIVTGIITVKYVIPRTMKQKDVSNAIKTIKDAGKAIEEFGKSQDYKDFVKIVLEGKELLMKIIEREKQRSS